MRKTESVNAACSPRGEWGHSVPQTFRQINLTRTLENSREARSHSSNNHTQHPAHAVCATNTQSSSTHSLCLCRLTSTQRHKQNWTLRWNKNSCDSAHVMSVSRSLVNRQPCIWWRRSHRSTVHVSVWKETAASPPPHRSVLCLITNRATSDKTQACYRHHLSSLQDECPCTVHLQVLLLHHTLTQGSSWPLRLLSSMPPSADRVCSKAWVTWRKQCPHTPEYGELTLYFHLSSLLLLPLLLISIN